MIDQNREYFLSDPRSPEMMFLTKAHDALVEVFDDNELSVGLWRENERYITFVFFFGKGRGGSECKLNPKYIELILSNRPLFDITIESIKQDLISLPPVRYK